MSLQVLFDAGDGDTDRRLAAWVQSRIRRCPPFKDGARGVGIVRNGALVAAAVYTDMHLFEGGGGNIYINFAADAQAKGWGRAPTRRDLGIKAPHWASRRAIFMLLAPPFLSWGCSRITAIIDRDFKSSRRLCAGVGFKFEGAVRKMLPGQRDGCIYGLLKDEFLGGPFARHLHKPQSQLAHAA